jgi:hypothetical protein
MVLVITSGNSIAAKAASCGSFGSAGTTSRTGELPFHRRLGGLRVGKLYAAIGGGLRARVDRQDAVGHTALSN